MFFRSFVTVLFLGFVVTQATSVWADGAAWTFGRSTNQDGNRVAYALVSTKVGNLTTNEISTATVAFTCTQGKVQFILAADKVDFGVYGRVFKFSYSPGGSPDPAEVAIMEVKDGAGYTVEYAKRLAVAILGQRYLVAGALDVGGNAIAMKISLNGSDRAIKRVFSDCGQTLTK